ncbi:MAG: glycoside hydrolase family 31 protein [Lentisphaeria bacterium]|nr:glycoside hydrolase family 31 protein [Lentisphaerota bacterium]MBR7145722.1 glycoside hydrolase family 31 protein [Lentisphaeria bacterium]
MKLNYQITRITADCVRIQIAPEHKPMSGSALNRYGFIFDDAVDNSGTPQLQINSENISTGKLTACNAENLEYFRMINASFSDEGSLVEFELFDDNEDYIGFGDLTRDRIYHRGYKANCTVSNVASYIPVPFFMSTRGYAIMVNSTHQVIFDMGCTDKKKLCWFDKSGAIDFYVWCGRDFKELIDRYTRLTGRPELPPKWSFGLWYIARTQANDAEVMNDAKHFREYNIPCDVFGLEPGWMDTVYDFSVDKAWSKERFPLSDYMFKNYHHTFISALKAMGYKLELWLCNEYDLSFEEERRIGNNPEEKETHTPVFCKEAEIDEHFSHPIYMDKITKPEEPWFKHLEKFVDWGADFFKQDGANQVCLHPDRVWRGNGMLDKEMHNLYPLLYSRQMNEGFAKFTNRRPLVFTVSGWLGFQHYCGTWTGDTGGRIETLGAMLNTSCVGHSWATNDMEVAQAEGIHFGYLLPWSQINSWNYFRMPWLQGDKFLAMHQYYARLRSQLIPYIYSNAYQATQTGLPVLMPLAIEYQSDKACRNILHEYLFGRDLLVTIYKHDIYLPEGSWCDFWSGKVYSGNQHINDFQWPAERGGGLFLRSGAIVPMGEVMSHTAAKKMEKLDLVIYPGDATHSEFTLYEDDGITFEYRNGKYAKSLITLDRTESGWLVEINADSASEVREWSITLCGTENPAKVLNNGKTVAGVFNAARNELKLSNIQPGKTEIICK